MIAPTSTRAPGPAEGDRPHPSAPSRPPRQDRRPRQNAVDEMSALDRSEAFEEAARLLGARAGRGSIARSHPCDLLVFWPICSCLRRVGFIQDKRFFASPSGPIPAGRLPRPRVGVEGVPFRRAVLAVGTRRPSLWGFLRFVLLSRGLRIFAVLCRSIPKARPTPPLPLPPPPPSPPSEAAKESPRKS